MDAGELRLFSNVVNFAFIILATTFCKKGSSKVYFCFQKKISTQIDPPPHSGNSGSCTCVAVNLWFLHVLLFIARPKFDSFFPIPLPCTMYNCACHFFPKYQLCICSAWLKSFTRSSFWQQVQGFISCGGCLQCGPIVPEAPTSRKSTRLQGEDLQLGSKGGRKHKQFPWCAFFELNYPCFSALADSPRQKVQIFKAVVCNEVVWHKRTSSSHQKGNDTQHNHIFVCFL